MKAKLDLPAYGLVLEIELSDTKNLFREVSFFQSLPSKCGACGSPVRMEYRSPQGNSYYSIVCMPEQGKLEHELKLGARKNEEVLYVKPGWSVVPNSRAAHDDEADAEPEKETEEKGPEFYTLLSEVISLINKTGMERQSKVALHDALPKMSMRELENKKQEVLKLIGK